MLSKIAKIIVIALVAVLVWSDTWAATRKQVICLKPTGELLARRKCKSGEVVFTPDVLVQQVSQTLGGAKVGPTGDIGNKGAVGAPGLKGSKGLIDFSGCRIVSGYATNFLNPSSGDLLVSVACNPFTEFLFDEDYKTSALPGSTGTAAFIQSRNGSYYTIAGDTREYEATIYANRDLISGAGVYQLEANGICCPR